MDTKKGITTTVVLKDPAMVAETVLTAPMEIGIVVMGSVHIGQKKAVDLTTIMSTAVVRDIQTETVHIANATTDLSTIGKNGAGPRIGETDHIVSMMTSVAEREVVPTGITTEGMLVVIIVVTIQGIDHTLTVTTVAETILMKDLGPATTTVPIEIISRSPIPLKDIRPIGTLLKDILQIAILPKRDVVNTEDLQ